MVVLRDFAGTLKRSKEVDSVDFGGENMKIL